MDNEGIPTAIHYPVPLNLQPMFSYLSQKKGSVPIAEQAAREVLSLPMSAWLKAKDLEKVTQALCVAVS